MRRDLFGDGMRQPTVLRTELPLRAVPDGTEYGTGRTTFLVSKHRNRCVSRTGTARLLRSSALFLSLRPRTEHMADGRHIGLHRPVARRRCAKILVYSKGLVSLSQRVEACPLDVRLLARGRHRCVRMEKVNVGPLHAVDG